ncbi:MAG: hypothetical protein ACRCU5_08880, partial [Rhizobiaceae bacterium]
MAWVNSHRIVSAVAFSLYASAPALGAPATDAEAARLTTLFQSYTFGLPDIVSVKPSGDSYDLTLDFKSALANLPQPDSNEELGVSISPIRMKLTDQGSGKWLVEQTEGFDFSFKSGVAMQMSAKIGKVNYSGIFSESLGYMESMEGDFGDIAFAQTAGEGEAKIDIVYSTDSIKYTAKNERAADGTINGVSKLVYTGFKETLKMPPIETSGIPLDFTINIAEVVQDGSFQGLKTKEIGELIRWGFALAQEDPETLDKAQSDELKVLLLAALPVFNEVKANASYNNITVSTILGEFGLAKMGILIDLKGFLENGLFRESITLEKLT